MIEVLTGFPETVVAFTCNGQVTKQDYKSTLTPTVEQALAQHKRVRLYYQIDPGFSGFEPGAMWDDFKVGMEHLFRWDRLAVVTDVEWIRSMFKAFSFVIPCEARVFQLEEAANARTWIVEGTP
ncbi:STAS/SEC14 domain-containing protein [Nitrospira sp.]|nr:STAS/SEC14 domain-containing protein [Nitrospira sp.]